MLTFQSISLTKSVLESLGQLLGKTVAFVQPMSLTGDVASFFLLILTWFSQSTSSQENFVTRTNDQNL